WGKTEEVQRLFATANRGGGIPAPTGAKLQPGSGFAGAATGMSPPRLQLTADVYPYTYWSSTISVLTNSRDWGNKKVWEDGLKDVGGAQNVRLVRYSP